MKQLKIWTDGSCLKNPGPGGWAYAIVMDGKIKEGSGGVVHTTNNRMELSAAIEGLKALSEPCSVDLYTDSKYVQLGMIQWVAGWIARAWCLSTGKPVLNVDLWRELLRVSEPHQVQWHWVKAHGVDVMNNRVDHLAREAAESMR